MKYGWELRDMNERASRFVKNIVIALNIIAPEKIFKVSKAWEGKIWYTEDIRRASMDRNRAYGKAIYTGAD